MRGKETLAAAIMSFARDALTLHGFNKATEEILAETRGAPWHDSTEEDVDYDDLYDCLGRNNDKASKTTSTSTRTTSGTPTGTFAQTTTDTTTASTTVQSSAYEGLYDEDIFGTQAYAVRSA